jgi:AcrR family transcriptional regulator
LPRKLNPAVEPAILKAALALLDQGGLGAITMRDVARRAGTTTPTLYERFDSRESLLWALLAVVQQDIYGRVCSSATIEDVADSLLAYFHDFPGRFDLMNQYWPKMMCTERPRPTFDFVTLKLMEQTGCTAPVATETTYSLTALVIGTVVLRRTAGEDTPVAKALLSNSIKAVRAIRDGIPG